MILIGSQRAGAADLAAHLLNDRENDHVTVFDLKGFVAGDLHGALQETHAISKGTKCEQYLFSLSLNPPIGAEVTEQDFVEAIERVEAKLGLTGQARAIVFHEKEGRRHAHAVWSRIDAEKMKAINLPHYKSKLKDLARDLYLHHGWELPDGLKVGGGRSPFNFTLAQWQQAKRQGLDPREIKQSMLEAWHQSDNAKSFAHALEDKGYLLAQGDRRGFVVLDCDQNIYSVPRWLDLKTKEVKAKLGDPSALRTVDQAKALIGDKIRGQLRGFITAFKDQQKEALAPLRAEHQAMKSAHRDDRKRLIDLQAKRHVDELKERLVLRSGLGGLWDRFTGRSAEIRRNNEQTAWHQAKRDQQERDDLVFAQMVERRELQTRILAFRDQQKADRSVMARMIGDAYRAKSLGITETSKRVRSFNRKAVIDRYALGTDPPEETRSEATRSGHPKGPDLTP